jgi:Leucine-rich repeat (LRR) protein
MARYHVVAALFVLPLPTALSHKGSLARLLFRISKLTTLDLSKNKLSALSPKITNLKLLKSLNVDDNKLSPGTLIAVSQLTKLKNLSASNNFLGRPHPDSPNASALPNNLPSGLKTILLANNSFSSIPPSVVSPTLISLERLDLSSNNLASVPESIVHLVALSELNLDDNSIVSLPTAMGQLKKLKVLSLKRNKLSASSNTGWSERNPQPLPKELFRDTLLIDLNLHGNPMTNTQLNAMEGYDAFLLRRREVKVKDIMGGAMTNMDGCGLE